MPTYDVNNKILYNAPINTDIKKVPIMYIYDKLHTNTVPIQTTTNSIYDIAIIQLEQFGFIKDFFFTIIDKDNYINNRINIFSTNFIELEIVQIVDQKNFILHTKLDAILLNSYIPIKKLGHKLPNGIYYYSFSSDPKENQLLGGLDGTNYVIRIKVKKMSGVVKFYSNEYIKEII